MRRFTLLILAIIFSISIFAQSPPSPAAPPGINYQGVAIGAGGQALSMRSLCLRISILNGSATGTVAYEETQTVTTDSSGLFAISIGSGTVVSGIFSGISWSSGSEWLRTEMDTSCSGTYILMGCTQFMSVPYALYAAQCPASTVTYDYPDGTDSITPVYLDYPINYTVPAGMNFYITSLSMDTSGIAGCTQSNNVNFWINAGDSCNYLSSGVFPNSFSFQTAAIGPGSQIQNCNGISLGGFLVRQRVVWVEQNIRSASYTVPTGKVFVVKHISCYSGWSAFTVDGTTHKYLSGSLPLNAGQTIAAVPGSGYMTMIGYLKDK